MMDFKAFIITDIVTIGVIILLVVIFAIKISRNNKKRRQNAFVPDNRYAVSNNLDNKYDIPKKHLQLFLDAVSLEFREAALRPLLLEDHDVDDLDVLFEIAEDLSYVNAKSAKDAESVAEHAKSLCTSKMFNRYFTVRGMEEMITLSDIMTDILWLAKYPLKMAISISENSTGNVVACYRAESGESVQHDFKALRYHEGIFNEDGLCCDVYFLNPTENLSVYSYVLEENIKDETILFEILNHATYEVPDREDTAYIFFEYRVNAATKD